MSVSAVTPVGKFELEARDDAARAGLLHLAHGQVHTPAFMPVGTQGTVKAISPEELGALGAEMVLANAYHLYLRPGHELVRRLGGLHDFMGWHRPILTDSGGYQVFSLAKINKVTDEGVWFQSHIDGSRHFITPELVMEIEHALAADVIMAFDECPPGRAERQTAQRAVVRTHGWLERSVRRFDELSEGDGTQVLLPVLQGATFPDLRLESLRRAGELREWSGFGIGGLSVGEPKDLMYEVLADLSPELPQDGVRYLMGVGYPTDLLEAVRLGYDIFDCVAPTRNGRNGTAFTSAGPVNVKVAAWRDDGSQMEEGCGCWSCARYSRAYVRHLFVAGELLGLRVLSIHNLYFLTDLMRQARSAIQDGRFNRWVQEWLARYAGGEVGDH
ncbi:MAG: tRNA guanosine(34) transglycosylase Tgt [Gemmatimonadota bacterium]|nr:MAG: tRNA guanosine(34) transglycosylase Tgt [Gemmatimonadota bacterium]